MKIELNLLIIITMPDANVPFWELIYAKISKVVDIFFEQKIVTISFSIFVECLIDSFIKIKIDIFIFKKNLLITCNKILRTI